MIVNRKVKCVLAPSLDEKFGKIEWQLIVHNLSLSLHGDNDNTFTDDLYLLQVYESFMCCSTWQKVKYLDDHVLLAKFTFLGDNSKSDKWAPLILL